MLAIKHAAATAILVLPTAIANATDCASLASLNWLLGEWQQITGNTITSESWQRVSQDTFEGVGETLAADTGKRRAGEELRLVAMQGSVFFIAKVSSNERPVPFMLTDCGSTFATFENPEHDFPRKLAYRLSAEDRLTVTVSDGGERGFEIRFERESTATCENCDE